MPITGAEVTAAARAAGAVRRVLRRPDPVRVLKRRAEVRDEIRKNLRWPDKKDEVPEIIVVNHKRYDNYGELDDSLIGRGVSDWFKAEVKGLHDRGLETYIAVENVVIRKDKAYSVRDEPDEAVGVYIVGRIPYERIAYIDWSPDPMYSLPRFYVVYDWRNDPFREVVVYGRSHLQLEGLKYVGEGGGPIKRTKRRAERIKYQLQFRRQDKEARRNRYSR